jgi:hypothetical protein
MVRCGMGLDIELLKRKVVLAYLKLLATALEHMAGLLNIQQVAIYIARDIARYHRRLSRLD